MGWISLPAETQSAGPSDRYYQVLFFVKYTILPIIPARNPIGAIITPITKNIPSPRVPVRKFSSNIPAAVPRAEAPVRIRKILSFFSIFSLKAIINNAKLKSRKIERTTGKINFPYSLNDDVRFKATMNPNRIIKIATNAQNKDKIAVFGLFPFISGEFLIVILITPLFRRF